MKRARPAMLTETLEVVRMSSMLPAVLLFVGGSPSFCVYMENFPPRSWYPGIVIRGSQLTGLARLSSNHDVDFCRIIERTKIWTNRASRP